MSFRLLSWSPKHFRNGTTWFGRIFCKLIGEQKYDNVRVWKRTMYAEWWYLKQYYLHWVSVNKADWANFFAILPKTDSSHGFPWKETPSRYAQFGEDTTNSDGYGGWYTYIWVAGAALWNAYIYAWPRRFENSYDFLAEESKPRQIYVDGFQAANIDQTLTFWFGYWESLLTPHKFEWFRNERAIFFGPDSRIMPTTITLNRRNTFFDHYWQETGESQEML
ncbi:unnamed protein product [Blepharisma stoltei]|uniref:Uncharacterized protein n=1 Tax=Blepharisma stoltei TaxID=1481888 RepID=A0AAU9IKY8_9CILI|nr:unnamed protein product [Blepharisma stoltei]